jgi:DNA-binding response OmpR family regulator
MAARTEVDRGRVLVVEDEFLVSLGITTLLKDLGFTIAGLAARVAEASAMAHSEDLALAVLDINVAGEMSWPVALKLKARGVPILFLSGYLDSNVQRPPELLDVPICVKPLSESELNAVINQLTKLPQVADRAR